VSLTVNELSAQKDALSVLLIPHTLERTNLKNLGAGSKVNVEYDWMAKVILDRLEETLPSLTQPMHSIFERGRHIEDI
jgi:riboflavin synthase